mmetsp:Transcript_5901/g.16581  ORF Transcript_5901/g.16581 Transcript_5901/m.16581 type:complete len:195 (+) Transcript_5901:1109-1693(+)
MGEDDVNDPNTMRERLLRATSVLHDDGSAHGSAAPLSSLLDPLRSARTHGPVEVEEHLAVSDRPTCSAHESSVSIPDLVCPFLGTLICPTSVLLPAPRPPACPPARPAAVAYLCMEYITAVAYGETSPMVQVRRAAGKLWMENQKAVLARITDLATQDQPSDMVACQQNDIDNKIEEEGCEKKTTKMKTQTQPA